MEKYFNDVKNIAVLIRRSLMLFCMILPALISRSQEQKKYLELYGFVMMDAGYNFNTIDPDWFDVMRPSKLPAYPGEFAPGGQVFLSIRQTRFGVRSFAPTSLGDLKTQIDFDMFGFGKDVGQTTIHLVNAFAQLGRITIGQTASVLMDTEVFPVTLDYWGPSSRVFFLNIQLRYAVIQKESERLLFALERPGATADLSDYANTIQLPHVKPVLRFPNLTGQYKRGTNWGYLQVAGIIKSLQWQDQSDTSAVNLSGKTAGWGFTTSSVINAGKKIKFKLQGEYGKGIENYIADVTPDVALSSNPGNSITPIKGKAIPVFGFLAFTEIAWTKKLSSSIGYSLLSVSNTDLQSAGAFGQAQYALANLRYYPTDNLLMGIEYQFGQRKNNSDGFSSNASKIQLSIKVNFSGKFFEE